MADQLTLYLFGDQTFDMRPHLKELFQKRQNPVLEDFLGRAYNALRGEIYELPPPVRDDMPRFTCLEDLIRWNQDEKRCIPLEMAVTCMYQLSSFISQADTWCCGSPDRSRVLGLCTGALAAATVSCSSGLIELVPNAVKAVCVAFRTGMRVTSVANRLLTACDADESWSIVVPGTSASETVKQACEKMSLPLVSRPYISAYSLNGITVSGPPPSLTLLINSEGFKQLRSKTRSIPTYAPYHAPQLYSQYDVVDIVGDTFSDGNAPLNRGPSVLSPGVYTAGNDFPAQLKAAVEGILLKPIRWASILKELHTCIQDVNPKSFNVVPIATTADQVIYTALKQTSLRALIPATPVLHKSVFLKPEPTNSDPNRPKLAIIGMSGRYPGAKDNDAFWSVLHQGLDVHKPVPPLHWDAKTHVDPSGLRKNTSATPYGCWLDDPAGFDARFFNISPREAPQIDPAQRLALMTAYEAIEQAGIVPDSTPSTRPDRVGVFYGVTSNDWMETNSAQNIDTYFIPGGNRAFIPGRINYCFKFSGPSYAVDTACSSSLAGIHLACNSLWRRDIDTAIAGGTNVLTNPDFTAGLDRGHFLSRTGNCKTFDDGADGYCRGEGIGTIVMKRLDDALADNDPILGVILGAYTNHSAESESITRPHSGAQRAIFTKILNQAAVDPYTVSYVEMHGTGTQAGDAGEMSSVLDTFAPPLVQAKRARRNDEALYLGSAKANIGHGEAASGVSSLIKVLMMMQKSTIVPHCGIKTRINRKFPTDLEERNVHIALKPTAWEKSHDASKPRRAFVNNFSAAGGNSALLVQEAPVKEQDAVSARPDPRSTHLVAVSAKSGVSLHGNLKSMIEFLKQNQGVSIPQLSFTTTARRMHHQHRVMLTGSSAADICSQAEKALEDDAGKTRPKSVPKVVFTFTGQGAQYPGMGKELFEHFSVFRTEVLQLERIVQSLGFPSMLGVIQSEETDINIFSPVAVQLANLCMQIALCKLWSSWNITPAAVVGHSVGEYAALNVAGVLSDADAIYLVGTRAGLIQENCTRDTHSMLVVKGPVDDIESLLDDKQMRYEISCINSPVETVLAGSNEAIDAVKECLGRSGIKSTLLKIPFAFHSSQMEPALPAFTKLAGAVTFSSPKIPVVCPLDGSIIDPNGLDSGNFGPEYLASHCRQPVNMFKALTVAYKGRIITNESIILEIGPHPAISGMVRATLGTKVVSLASSQRARDLWQVLGISLKALYEKGANIRWAEYCRDFPGSHRVISLPAYSWDLKEYWIQYVNDWSLRKGDPPLLLGASPKLESTSIHRIVEETSDSAKTRIVVEADITRKDLSPLVQGHEVDGIPLCTPSVYADIALTLGKYLRERYRPAQQESLVDVSDMTISKALILREGATSQLLQAQAEADWSSRSVAIKFVSFNNKQKLQEHARCVVRFRDGSLQRDLQADAVNTKQKLQALRDGIAKGITARFNRPMVYRAIRPLARFHDDYRAIDEIVLNSNTLEASSRLSFGNVKRDGDFHTHPAIIDSLTQCCGFTMNCNDASDLDVEVFMNHGWESFQMFEPIDLDKEYTTYSRMEKAPDKLWHGDSVIFDGDRVVAHFGKIAIQGVPRRILKAILSIESGSKSQNPQVVPKKGHEPSSRANITQQNPPSACNKQSNSKITTALLIIAEDSGIAVADLTDDTVFADVGIDSLLGLTISARLKEDLDIDLDFNALFYEYPRVSDLKAFLGGTESASQPSTPQSSGSGSSAKLTDSTSITDADEAELFSAAEVNFHRALQIVSEESGVAQDDLAPDTNFTDSGIDSLLSLVIVSRLRDELDLDIQHESFFLDCATVGDLRSLIFGDAKPMDPGDNLTKADAIQVEESTTRGDRSSKNHVPAEADSIALVARKKAVDQYVRKYTAGFSPPTASPNSDTPMDNEKVILITGASGSLGGHLVYHMAQLPDVKTVVCLNRENRQDPYIRQYRAMREKGIRFPEVLKPKLLVFQTDTSKPKFGLSSKEYQELVGSVTHLVHNAWPMSAKRALPGFESQFQIMRNLIDFASGVASRRPEQFKFSFQMVSSIGVVGHFGLMNADEKVTVPEERVDIESVLPNGYGDAKWGCERMLDETLHKHPSRFRTMATRLGQIAGSKTSGYWNPMEHFGFVIKSSQTLNALPDVGGTVYWTPVNDVAGALTDLVLGDHTPYPIYHIENPVGQPWHEVNRVLSDALKIPNLIPFGEWVQRVRDAPQQNNPASTLLEFLDSNYLRMSCGGLVLDVAKTLEHSQTLATVGPVSEEVVRKYMHIWKEIGFLN